MVQIPSPNHLLLPVKSSSLVAVGSNIYKIGGSDDVYGENFWKPNYSSSVSVLDCQSHTWKQAPSMTMERNSAFTSSLIDGKIYVAGGCKDKYVSYPNWIEVFDPKTQIWSNVKNPRVFELHHEFRDKAFVAKSFEVEGKLYMVGNNTEVYNPKEGTWKWIGDDDRSICWILRHIYCVVDDVLLFWDKKVFRWYDFKVSLWKVLKGVEGFPDFGEEKMCKMVDLGGKIGVLWEKYVHTQKCQDVQIWCAEIGLERRDDDEIWGKVEWLDVLLIVPL